MQPPHLYLHHDGYPTGAAWRFAETLRASSDPAALLATVLRSQPRAEQIENSDQDADAEYRYQVQLLPGPDPQLLVQGWRRLPGHSAWYPRCGPLPLAAFIQRFLPGGLPD
ncbi:MAG: hypothetical protein AAFX65_09350 [Cyanobacteria bacterium J06638_7]